MDKEIIEKILLEISTPTGLTYSGDTTICNDEVKDIMNYINNIEQQCKKQKEIIDKLSKIIFEIKDSIEITGGYPSNYIDDLLKILEDKEVSE